MPDHHFLYPEQEYMLSLDELVNSFGISVDTLLEIVAEGIVTLPLNQNQWRFDTEAIRRIRMVIQLNQDLAINYPGCALVLELLDQIELLQHRPG